MKNKFHVFSMLPLMAAFATTSAWAEAENTSCPASKGFVLYEGICYYNMPETQPENPLIVPKEVKSFKLRYQDGDGTFTSKLNIHCENIRNTLNIEGSANLASGGTLEIFNRVDITPFESDLVPALAASTGFPESMVLLMLPSLVESIQPTTSMAKCTDQDCSISKKTGLNALSVLFAPKETGTVKSFELTVTQEQYDFGSLQILHMDGFKDVASNNSTAAEAFKANFGIDLTDIPDEVEKGALALVRGADENPLGIPQDTKVDFVYFDRKFTVNDDGDALSTIVLPFDYHTDYIDGAMEIMEFDKIEGTQIKVNRVFCWLGEDGGDGCPASGTTLQAYKPYLVQMMDGSWYDEGFSTYQVDENYNAISLSFLNPFGATLKATPKKDDEYVPYVEDRKENNWVFRGMLSYKKWDATADKDELTGCNTKSCAYGYAAMNMTGKNTKGKFVRLAAGAYIYPFRAYLVFDEPKDDAVPANFLAPANASYVLRPDVIDLPDEMEVVANGKEGKTTVIGRFNTRTGEFHINNMKRTYDLKGRRVNGTNNARGAYYGKKVLVK